MNLTPEEIKNEILRMDNFEQVNLIIAIANTYKRSKTSFIMDLSYTADKFNERATKEEKMNAIQLFENIVNYLRGWEK